MTEQKAKKIELTADEIKLAFRGIYLEENYSFLEEDLIKLANGFIAAAEPKIRKAELAECVKFVRSLNTYVAEALDEKRKIP
jgi:hypothetical protein